ncbi:hypothetical protein B296_00026254, partial [Ensete ventricosum]
RHKLCAPSRKFKILAIPNVLAHVKTYEYGFTNKSGVHKLCMKSCFDRFFMHRLRNSKYYLFPMYFPIGSRTSTVSWKNITVINFVQSHVQGRDSISF